MDNQLKVIIYYENICKIGGIETWIYYLCQHLYKYYEITVLYKTCDDEQLRRLAKFVDVRTYDSKNNYKCDTFINATNWKPFPKNIKYNKCLAVIHCDYNYFKEQIKLPHLYEGVDEFICVSKNASDGLYKAYGESGTIINNILGKKIKTNKILHLVSFTRLTEEKGLNRMLQLAKILKDNNIKFEWKIFTSAKLYTEFDEMIFMNPTLDVYDYMVDADYLVQLSSSEAFCYSVHESLQYGTPVLVTNIPAFNDLVIDGYNGYKFNLDMSNVDVEKILNNIPTEFDYDDNFETLENKWFNIIGEPILNNNPEKELVKIKVLWSYEDLELGRKTNVGEILNVTKERASILTSGNNSISIKLCEYIN